MNISVDVLVSEMVPKNRAQQKTMQGFVALAWFCLTSNDRLLFNTPASAAWKLVFPSLACP